MGDERIRLLLDMGMSAQEAEKVIAALDRMKVSAKGVHESYELMARAGEGYVVQERAIESETDKLVRKMVEETQARKAANLIYEESIAEMQRLGAATVTVGTSATHAVGDRGRGLLGFSYAVQDFTSVLSGGGGFARAVGSITNNIDQMGMAAGLSAANAAKLSIGFTGFAAALPVLIPLFQSLWQAVSGGAAAEDAAKKLEDLEKRFKRLIETPTKAEKTGLEALKEAVTEGPSGDVFKGLAEAIASTPGMRAELTEEQRASLRRAREIRRTQPEAAQARVDEVKAALAEANRQQAREIMAGMIEPGAAGEAARQRATRLVRGFPGAFPAGFLGDIERAEPGAQKAQEELERQGRENIARAATDEKAQKERDKKFAEQAKVREEVQQRIQRDTEAKNRGLVSEAEEQQSRRREVERDKAKAAHDLAQEVMAAAAPEETDRQRRHRRATEQVGGLMEQGPAIVGEAFGPQAAQAAAYAKPEEVHAMRAATIQNLEAGQLPLDAVLDAFREVYQQSQRNRARGQAFGAQMRGMQGRFQQGGQTAMDR